MVTCIQDASISSSPSAFETQWRESLQEKITSKVLTVEVTSTRVQQSRPWLRLRQDQEKNSSYYPFEQPLEGHRDHLSGVAWQSQSLTSQMQSSLAKNGTQTRFICQSKTLSHRQIFRQNNSHRASKIHHCRHPRWPPRESWPLNQRQSEHLMWTRWRKPALTRKCSSTDHLPRSKRNT